eukprot:g13997.t1
MEGLPLDVFILVAVAVVGLVSLVGYIWRKLGSNQGATSAGGAAEGASRAGGGDAAPGRARFPGGECSICLRVEVVSPVQTNCGHWFCAGCVLDYYDGLGRVRIKCPLCRHEVTMLHPAAEDPPSRTAPAAAAAANATSSDTATDGDKTAPAPLPQTPQPMSPETQERIGRFNERNSGRWRSPWQVIKDAPLLLRRLWADLRRGDTHVFGELIRRGVQLQLFFGVLYFLSPVDVMPESLLGVVGLVDDIVIAIVLLLYITTVYRAILLTWERSRASRAAAAATAAAFPAAAAADTPAVPLGQGSLANSPMIAGLAAVAGVAAGLAATSAGAAEGVAALAAGAVGALATAAASRVASSSSGGARGWMPPPLARDW